VKLILRWFAYVRELEANLREAGARRIFLEDRVRWFEAQNAQLAQQLEQKTKEATHSDHCIADFFSEWVTGRKIFGVSPDLPADSPESEVVRRPKMQGRALQRQQTNDALQQILRDSEAALGIDLN
jgi:hypothetical protein